MPPSFPSIIIVFGLKIKAQELPILSENRTWIWPLLWFLFADVIIWLFQTHKKSDLTLGRRLLPGNIVVLISFKAIWLEKNNNWRICAVIQRGVGLPHSRANLKFLRSLKSRVWEGRLEAAFNGVVGHKSGKALMPSSISRFQLNGHCEMPRIGWLLGRR